MKGIVKATVALLLSMGGGCSRTEGPAVKSATQPALGTLALDYGEGRGSEEPHIQRAQDRVRMHPGRAQPYLDLAVLFMRKRRETSTPALMLYVRDAVEAALARRPESRRARLLRGLIHLYDHQFEEAKAIAEAILRESPDHSGAHLLRGDAALELGDYPAAAQAYQTAVDLKPDLRSYNRAAHITWIRGDAESALSLLNLAINAGSLSDPESIAWCLVDQADIYRATGRPGEGFERAEAALRLVPGYVPALVAQARAQVALGERASALDTYRAVLHGLATVDTLVEMADLLEGLGRQQAAQRRLQQAAVLAADDPRPLAHYLGRRSDLGGAKLEQALRLSRHALQERRNVETWDTRALVLIRAGRLAEGETALFKAAALGQPRAEMELHWSLLRLAQGRERQARRHLHKALGINPHVDPRLVAELQDDMAAG